jgi:hypothetical protein
MAKIKDYLEQDGTFLLCKKSCTLELDLETYSFGDNIIVENDEIWVKNLISKIIFDDIEFPIVLDYSVNIKVQESKKAGHILILKFTTNSIILETVLDVSETKDDIIYVKRLLSGKEVSKDTSHLLLKMYGVYKNNSSADLVHFEVVLSNVLRDKKNQGIPARLARIYDPALFNINSVVFQESFLSGIEFERISKALETGLVSERPREISVLERVLLGELV